MTKIEWTHQDDGSQGKTWNPVVGCSKISAGCQNCYAIKDAHRMAANPNPKISSVYAGLTERRGDRTEWTGKVNFVPERLEIPLKTRKPTTWFVNSMSDLLHPDIGFGQLFEIASVMLATPQHTYQVLTKRPERLPLWESVVKQLQSSCDGTMVGPSKPINPLPNVWLGVSVENQEAAIARIPLLLQTPAAVRFLSCEPLLGPLHFKEVPGFNRVGLDLSRWWIIAGGESGPKARPCDVTWLHSIVKQTAIAGVPCFIKQLGSNVRSLPVDYRDFGRGKGKMNNPAQWPPYLRVRQFPISPKVSQP